jgi:hypothetical protein
MGGLFTLKSIISVRYNQLDFSLCLHEPFYIDVHVSFSVQHKCVTLLQILILVMKSFNEKQSVIVHSRITMI